jgi:uncharacterized membrane protein
MRVNLTGVELDIRSATRSVLRSAKERAPEVATTGLWLVLTLLLSVALALAHSPLTPVPGVVTLLLVPGAVIMSLLDARPGGTAGRVVLAVCLSMMTIMVVGGVVSLIGPHLGIAHPLNVWPETVIWSLLAISALTIGAVQRRDPIQWIFDGVRATHPIGPTVAALLVVISILGVAQLNHTGNDRLAVLGTTLDVLALLAGIIGGWSRSSRWPLNALLYGASLALLLSTSLRGGHLFGWDIQQEFGTAWTTSRDGVWRIPADHDPYGAMLSLTVFPAILHSVVKLRLLAFFQLVVPAIMALLPVAVFATIRKVPRWITTGRSSPRPGLAFAVVVALIISSVAYSSELVSITRQAMALTLLTALVMVLFDRAIPKHSAQILVGLLIVTISFTHYTTSYLLAVILAGAWPVGVLWSKGWIGTPRANREQHRYAVQSRNVINGALVAVAVVAALGWNLAITRNDALTQPAGAIVSNGTGFEASTNSVHISPFRFEQILIDELKKPYDWLVRVPGSRLVHLLDAPVPSTHGVIPSLGGPWKELSFLAVESLWGMLGIALIYGVFRLGRRRSYEYSSDLVGLAVAGLALGAILRFSGTLAAFYDPERAAIFTAILLSAPVTLFLDDVASYLGNLRNVRSVRVVRVLSIAGLVTVTTLIIANSGLGALMFGGQAPGSLSANDVNVDDFTVSAPEVATAKWLRTNVSAEGLVQTDYFGQIVMHSEPGRYHLVTEIVPAEIDTAAYVYLSATNLGGDLSQAETPDGVYQAAYRTTVRFFNQNFYVVYSTGTTRVYHR